MCHEDTFHHRYLQRDKQIMIFMVYFVTMVLNTIPATQGVSKIYSPHEIATHQKLNINKECKVHFGSYVESIKDPKIKNKIESCTEECIALGSSGNWQGSTICFY